MFTYQRFISYNQTLRIVFSLHILYNAIRSKCFKKTTLKGLNAMKDETIEMLKLIADSSDPDQAALTAFALLLDFLKRHEESKETTSVTRPASRQPNLPA